MEAQIKCPHCDKIILDDQVVDATINGTGRGSDYMVCDCGERITYWGMTAQLRNQKKLGIRAQNWFHSLFTMAK